MQTITAHTTPTNPAAGPADAATQPATLDHAGIAARIPHGGRMCLLDRLLAWDATHIVCQASSHSDAANPLRSPPGLLAHNAIEYAAQAMALHGGLRAAPGAAPRPGFLASARQVVLHVARLDDRPGPLAVRCQHLMGDADQAQYQFSVHDADNTLLVQGRAVVVLNTPLVAPPHH